LLRNHPTQEFNVNKLLNALMVILFLLSTTAFAQQVSYNITATVTNFDDSAGKLQGAITLGQQITGTYTFDDGVPDSDVNPQFAFYDQTNTGAAGFDLTAGGLSLKSEPTQPGFMHSIDIGNDLSDHFHIGSWGNVPLPNGTPVWDINVDFYDSTGTALNNTLLSSTPPDITKFEFHDINISGDSFWISAKIVGMDPSNPTDPNLVTYSLSTTVTWVNDISGALGGAIVNGQSLPGTYTFNITTPDEEPDPTIGRYTHQTNSGVFGFDFSANGLTLKSDPVQAPMHVELYNSDFNDNYMSYVNGLNVPLPSGATITDISFYMYDDSANMITSDQLSSNAPVINSTGWAEVVISGMSANGVDFFQINATINSVTVLNPPDPNLIVVSPPSGIYDRAQMFDIALIFAPGLQMIDPASIGVYLNGIYQPLTSCWAGAPNPENRQTFICPGMAFQLGTGLNTLDFEARQEDGTVLRKSAQWNMISY